MHEEVLDDRVQVALGSLDVQAMAPISRIYPDSVGLAKRRVDTFGPNTSSL